MYFLLMVLAYILGSIPNSLIIGKKFYKMDIRNYGSGNLGGTNAVRVLGNIGFLVMFLDGLKCFIAVFLGSLYSTTCAAYCGFLCALGHCYPLFAGFKGGKAVACSFGFLFSTVILVSHDYLRLILPILLFIIILKLTKYVSLCSVITVFFSFVLSLFQKYFSISLANFLLSILVIYRHKENIKRLINGTENKFEFKKSSK